MFIRKLLLSLAIVKQSDFFGYLQTLNLISENQKMSKNKVWLDWPQKPIL